MLHGAKYALSIVVAAVLLISVITRAHHADDDSAVITASGAAAAKSLVTAAAAAAKDVNQSQPSKVQSFDSIATTKRPQKADIDTVTSAGSTAQNQASNHELEPAFTQELKTYLEAKFADIPAALRRIQAAWHNEQKNTSNTQTGSTYRSSKPFQQWLTNPQLNRNHTVKSMSQDGLLQQQHVPPAVAAKINALYEADHPKFQSRMDELVRGRGYPLERHTVVTSDGYELVVFRIPHGKHRNTQPGKRPVVYLAHGVTLASDSFVILNENESIGLILADAGFDVWLGNTRGNTYSRRNVLGLYPYQLEFWYFSIDELALIDTATMIDYALNASGATKLAFTGHSQGCTFALMLCAEKPEYNQKLSVVAHMGPVTFVDFIRAPFLRFAATNYWDQIFLYGVFANSGFGEFIPNRLTAPIYLTLCPKWILDEVCAAALSFVFYGPSIFITPDDYISISTTWPSSVGVRNLVHWAQMLRSPELELRKYDFGTNCHKVKSKPLRGLVDKPMYESCNQEQYGTTEPPVYNLSKVTCPNVIFQGENDVVAVVSDVAEMLTRIDKGAHVASFFYRDYGHMDYVWDRNAKHAVDLADIFFRYSPGTF